MTLVTVLDDYQNVALSAADWSPVVNRDGTDLGTDSSIEVQVVSEHIADVDRLVETLVSSDIVVAMRERTAFPDSVLARLPNLRLLVTTGMRNAAIDVAAANRRGITVCGTAGGGSSVPELTIGMIIALTRHFVDEDRAIRAGRWQHTIGPTLAGKTLGVVGLGRLGTQVAQLAQAFEMTVIAWSEHLTQERASEHGVLAVDKDALFERSDVVTIHLPLSERSAGLVGAAELRLLGASGYLVNTSRGPIVDEPALIAALNDGTIAGAALDVYDIEPLPQAHPLRSAPHTLLLPHIGYVSTDTYQRFFTDVVEDIAAYLRGEPVRILE
ncbi:MAG TPA: D-2-hydroxyacid dehydrogenase family protein [Microbacteriaceae bacterium]|jgi:phosphoglycerate dehydrogenase-like enzyme|nr:D-2-hydroxyacid dehydrogenase family protein [Microbacteriaceae bacterium]